MASTAPRPRFSPEFAFAFRQTIPVLLGYLAIGLAFGLMMAAAHYPWWLAAGMCLVVYAGAAQYLAVSLLSTNAGLAETALMVFLVNARHMVYGVSLLERFRGLGAAKAYLIFALTDETYALVTSLKDPPGLDRKKVYLFISGLDQAYWTMGGLLGALAGSFLPIPTAGMGFALTALFMVLVVEQARDRLPGPVLRFAPFIIGVAASALSLALFGSASMLLPAIGIGLAALIITELLSPAPPEAPHHPEAMP
jgi:4-azaleucine resistance transporter AzlC